jgi:hypothetical protein
MKKLAAVFMLLLAGPALADNALVYNTIGNNVGGPNPVILSMPMNMDANHDVFMLANIVDPAGVKSISIYGNGKLLITCPKYYCMFTWPRTAMRSGQNTVVLQYTNSAGVQRQANGYVNKPAAL